MDSLFIFVFVAYIVYFAYYAYVIRICCKKTYKHSFFFAYVKVKLMNYLFICICIFCIFSSHISFSNNCPQSTRIQVDPNGYIKVAGYMFVSVQV